MEEYVGKICPFCKTEIAADDEVMICPACNTPHHKSCRDENKVCTAFGCSVTIDDPKADDEEDPELTHDDFNDNNDRESDKV